MTMGMIADFSKLMFEGRLEKRWIINAAVPSHGAPRNRKEGDVRFNLGKKGRYDER